MIFPVYGLDLLGYEMGLVVFTLVGVAFGFVLERSGFGQAPVLASQFYGTDTRVLKVMFSAIATAALGITILSGVGLLDLSLLEVPTTYLWPHLVGGLLFGVGFVVSGYCPGTSIVGLASGNADAGLTVVGVTLGSVVFGGAYRLLAAFYASGDRGALRVPELLGVTQAVIVVALLVLAVAAFIAAERAERFFAKRAQIEPPAGNRRTRNLVFAGLAVGAAVGLVTASFRPAAAAVAQPTASPLDIDEFAARLIERPDSMWIVDLRDPAACRAERIPGAICLTDSDPDGSFMKTMPSTRRLVLYSDQEPTKLPDAVRAFRGEVVLLQGGYQAFAKRYVEAPELPPDPSIADVTDYRLRLAVHGWITGAQVSAPPPPPASVKIERAAKKGGGC